MREPEEQMKANETPFVLLFTLPCPTSQDRNEGRGSVGTSFCTDVKAERDTPDAQIDGETHRLSPATQTSRPIRKESERDVPDMHSDLPIENRVLFSGTSCNTRAHPPESDVPDMQPDDTPECNLLSVGTSSFTKEDRPEGDVPDAQLTPFTQAMSTTDKTADPKPERDNPDHAFGEEVFQYSGDIPLLERKMTSDSFFERAFGGNFQ